MVDTARITAGRIILKGWRWQFFLKTKTEPCQFTCAEGVLLFGSMLDKFSRKVEKAANRYDASLVCERILAVCSSNLSVSSSVCMKVVGNFVSKYLIAKFE